ncbi:LuxR C-terminal-related transcriptional regulator [Streptosporangium algeriense]|uniref:LuxR C-terminal-related transcriptional regulator n=1 Tax=Streptosporangium algeriense TaxID=1682748 RepID=A0ABW3DWV2_9ACTN
MTDREHEFALAVVRGLSDRQIGREPSMTETTVKAHVSRAPAEPRLTNRVRAAIVVHEAGLRRPVSGAPLELSCASPRAARR